MIAPRSNTGENLLEFLMNNESVLDDLEPDDKLGHVKSMILKRTPSCLDELRQQDPQGAIDYLYGRKEAYKKIAQKHSTKISELRKEILATKQKMVRYRTKFKDELAMKKWWKYACITIGTGMSVLVLMTLIVLQIASSLQSNQVSRIPTSAVAQKSPASMLASVNILNGDQQGSGTVISQGPNKALILSAGHNFKGVLGNTFWVYFADGTFTKATLLVVDRKRDLAVASVDADTIIGRSYIPSEVIPGNVFGVGYTDGQGPNYRTLTYNNASWHNSRCVWEFAVTSGPFWNGDSGGGVFINDGLIAVTTERDRLTGKLLYACSHGEIKQFLKENESKFKDCGNYLEPPQIQVATTDAPPLWSPKPNVPIFTESRIEKTVEDLKIQIGDLRSKIQPVIQTENLLKRPSEIK